MRHGHIITERALAQASPATRRRNPDLFAVGAPQNPNHQSCGGNGLPRAAGIQAGVSGAVSVGAAARRPGKPRIRCTLVSYRRRLSPDASDALPRGFKHVRDAIAQSLGLDDADALIAWEYGQVQTRGQEGFCVRLEGLL